MEDRKNTIPSQGTEPNDEALDRVTGGISTRDTSMTCAWCGKKIFASSVVTGRDGKSYCGDDCKQKAFAKQAESLRPGFDQ